MNVIVFFNIKLFGNYLSFGIKVIGCDTSDETKNILKLQKQTEILKH